MEKLSGRNCTNKTEKKKKITGNGHTKQKYYNYAKTKALTKY